MLSPGKALPDTRNYLGPRLDDVRSTSSRRCASLTCPRSPVSAVKEGKVPHRSVLCLLGLEVPHLPCPSANPKP